MLTSRRCPYLPEVLAFLLFPLLAVAAAPAAPGSEATAQTPVPQSPPVGIAADSPADLESAVARVRALYFGHDFQHGAAEGEAALEGWPESSELEAWTLANLSRSWAYWSTRGEDALARAESLVESRPDDVWGAIALAHALMYHRDRRGEALEASLRPLELAPTLPEAVWVRGLVLHDRRQYQEIVALIEEKWPVVDRQWAELLTLKGNAYLGSREDPERVARGLEILARVREQEPENVNAHYLAGIALRLDRRRFDEATALLERAAALSPGSIDIARSRWNAIHTHPDLGVDEKRSLISVSANELLERRGQYPSILVRAGGFLESHGTRLDLEDLEAKGAELQDRVLTEFAHTEEAEMVLSGGWQRLSGRLLRGEVEDTVAAQAELSSMLWSYIDRPQHYGIPRILGDAYSTLFDQAWRDETVSPDTLLLLARGAAEHDPWLPHAQLASGLAERGVHLDAAREIAWKGIDAAEDYISRFIYDTPVEAADALDRNLAPVYAAKGYVELKAGDLVAAREAIDRALELRPDHSQVQFQAGALAEAEGDLDRAEIHYAWGDREAELWASDRPNRDALERLLMERHGSLDGYEEFIAGIEDRDRDSRRQRLAASRIEEPRDLPAIDLEWLDGGRIGADELEGRIVVINFWGVWCGPCVAEAPQIQQLHEKYRDDPGVVFLTVNAYDLDLDKVRSWMADNEYDYPVLVDDNFATRHGVPAYPTTWFAGTNGRIVFEYTGVSVAVYEEFVWRVEMLQGEAGAEVAGVAADPPADLESAIARVRTLYFAHDFHHGAAVGDAALERWPESSELVAWTVANLARTRIMSVLSAYSSSRAEEAVARAEALVESRPDDVWGAIALAHALTYHNDRRGEALEASLRPLELAPTMPEAVWVRGFILHSHREYQEVAGLIDEKWPVVDSQWAELLTLKGNAYLALRSSEGPERLAQGLETLDGARELDPENVNAHYLAGNTLLWERRVDEAAALLERAAALSPGSTDIATSHWRAIRAQPDLDAEEKEALISTSASALLERRGQYPGTLRSVASFLGFLELEAEAAELQDRVLTEFAHTEEAEWVLADRWRSLFGRLMQGQVQDTVAARAELSAMLWSFIDRPHHYQVALLGNAYRTLFNHTRQDETVSPDTLLLLARGAAAYNPFLPHHELAIGLAERGVHLDEARDIARDGIDAAEETVSERTFPTPAAAADFLDGALANAYAAIGYVELKAGDLAAARDVIDRALELRPDRPQIRFRAGALAEAEGDLEGAEIQYSWGERHERLGPGDKPNRDALERLYMERHGSMDGYEEFMAGIEERDRASRWQRVADSRMEEPRDLPAIELEWLDGGRIGADELEGRIVVINFWGVWCGPCVAEAPQIQQLHEKYRDDPGVVFLTINAFDLDLDQVRTWMADNEYDYPVLVDDNFVTRYGVTFYPTTWFADTEGQIVFEHRGASAAVYEEFVWRIEMLQAEAGAVAAEEAEGGG